MDARFSGTLFDGQSAAGRPVTIDLRSDGVLYYGTEVPSDIWPYDRLRLVSSTREGDRVSVSGREGSAARLTIEGAGVLDQLALKVPSFRRRPGRDHRTAIIVSGAIIATLVLLYLAYPVVKGALVAVVPDSWAESWGETMLTSIPGAGQACTEPEGVAALEVMTQRLAANADLPYVPKVQVVDTGVPNAFAAAGGHVVIFNGLIRDADEPQEVAGVLAHELGHVKYRHPLKRLIDVLGVEIFMGGIGGDVGAVGGVIMVLRYGRDDERQADEAAVEMLQSAGMRTDGLATFFDRMAEKTSEYSAIPDFLSTHPALVERSATVREMGGSEQGEASLTEEQWQALKKICGDLPVDEEDDNEIDELE